MQYSSWLTFFLVAFGGLAPALAAPLEDGHHPASALAHGLKAKQIAKRNETEHGCGGGTLASISATIENLLNNVTINVLSQDGNGNKN